MTTTQRTMGCRAAAKVLRAALLGPLFRPGETLTPREIFNRIVDAGHLTLADATPASVRLPLWEASGRGYWLHNGKKAGSAWTRLYEVQAIPPADRPLAAYSDAEIAAEARRRFTLSVRMVTREGIPVPMEARGVPA